MLANMQLLAQTRAAGVDGVIVDKNNKIRLLEGSYTLKREAQFGDFVSLIPVTQALKGVTLRGFKYPWRGIPRIGEKAFASAMSWKQKRAISALKKGWHSL